MNLSNAARNKKELLRALLEEVIIAVNKEVSIAFNQATRAESDAEEPSRMTASVKQMRDLAARLELRKQEEQERRDRVIAGCKSIG
jgi:hypothetical protein